MSATDWERWRDIPRSCVCVWEWNGHLRAYLLIAVKDGCPWHTRGDNT
jgi:hypothetical protein